MAKKRKKKLKTRTASKKKAAKTAKRSSPRKTRKTAKKAVKKTAKKVVKKVAKKSVRTSKKKVAARRPSPPKTAKQAMVERELEEGLMETFPASDPVALTDPTTTIK
ncbi:MAG TPA: hypothetical protein VNR39_04070 [Pseudolabrys sp.]|nr:hypothetical protein [Pseudolabrys sp.]